MVNGVPGCGGGCGAGVPAGNEDKWKGSYVQFRGSCNHDQTGAVQEAKRRLEELFFFVGVTEDFASSMFLLQVADFVLFSFLFFLLALFLLLFACV
jgi:hypothetical protein